MVLEARAFESIPSVIGEGGCRWRPFTGAAIHVSRSPSQSASSGIIAIAMPSQRIQSQSTRCWTRSRLLPLERDWGALGELALDALTPHSENEDARAFLSTARQERPLADSGIA